MSLLEGVVLNRGARKPSPRGRGWLRSSRVRGYDDCCLSDAARPSAQYSNPSPAASGGTLSLWERVERLLKARIRLSRLLRTGNVDCALDFGHHPVEPFLHLIIGKPQFDKAMAFNRHTARFVSPGLIEMMLAIELDREAEIEATEIRDESGDRHLPTEFQSIELAVAQLLPKHVLGRGASCTQLSSDTDGAFDRRGQFDCQLRRSQPLTRLLRSHPLPQGEGLRSGWEVKR